MCDSPHTANTCRASSGQETLETINRGTANDVSQQWKDASRNISREAPTLILQAPRARRFAAFPA